MSEPAVRPAAAVAGTGPRLGAAAFPRRALTTVAVVMLAVAAVPVYVRLSWTAFVSADEANVVLQAVDLDHGNLFLHGWTLSGAPFWLLEMPVLAAVAAVRGLGPGVVHEAGALIYVAFLLLAALLATYRLAPRAAWPAAGLTVALLLAPVGFVVRFVLLGPYHLDTTAAIVAALLAAARLHGLIRALVVGALLTVASISDPLTIWVGTAGIAGVLVLRVLVRRDRSELLLLGAAVLSAPLAAATLRAVRHFGGFMSLPLSTQISPPSAMVQHLRIEVDGFQLLFTAGPAATAGGIPAAWSALHLVFLLLALGAVGWALVELARGRLEAPFQMALAIIGLDIAATIASGQTADISAVRYLLPAYGLLAVVAGRMAAKLLSGPPLWAAATAVLGAQLVFLATFAVQQPVAPNPRDPVAAYLVANGLRRGFSDYWDSSSITLASGGRVEVRAVSSGGGRIWPYVWESKKSWYLPGSGGPATFVLEPLDGTGPDAASVLHAFGPPARTAEVGGFRVEIWTRDLSPLLGGT